MKKKHRTRRASYWGMAAKTATKDWGFGPVAGKGGKTRNFEDRNRKKVDYSKRGSFGSSFFCVCSGIEKPGWTLVQ